HRFDRLIIGEHGDRNLGAARRLRRSSGDPRTFRMERCCWFRTPVPRDHRVPVLDKVARHTAAHPAQSEECNIHGLTPVNAEWRHPCPPPAGNRINYGTLPLSFSSPQYPPLRDIFEMPAFPDLYGPSDRARVSPFPREPPLARAMPRRTQPGIRSACYFGQVEALLEKKSHDDSHSATGQAGTR